VKTNHLAQRRWPQKILDTMEELSHDLSIDNQRNITRARPWTRYNDTNILIYEPSLVFKLKFLF